MASNEYYHGSAQQPPYNPSSTPYYQSHSTPSPAPTPAPTYHSAYSAPSYSAPAPESHGVTSPSQAAGHGGVNSPFDTVFDDNAYPASSRPTPGTSETDIGHYGAYGQDMEYHNQYNNGQYGRDPYNNGGQPPYGSDIPLQDQPNKDAEMNDHIYDAPAGAASRQKKGKVRLGELGMLGSNRKRIPWIVYIFTLAQVGVFIGEIVRNGILTGSPIMIHPSFNPMIGPSTQVLINMGARYAPCMHKVEDIDEVSLLCPNATKNTQTCPLNELCGFGAQNDPKITNDNINQWWRFIVPIFMHAGIIHIGFNLLLQLTLAKEMEMAIGSLRFFLVYASAGIFGFVMGGNFAAPFIASTGASGSLFGIIALTLLDLLYSWKDRKSPVKELMFILLDMVISFALGLLPGLDNFSHIGGFITGICVGVCVLHSPNSLRRRMGEPMSYATVSENTGETPPPFHKNPVGFFKGRKPLWWAWWLVRAGFLVMIIIVFIVLINDFYNGKNTCHWCKYLSCIPVNDWCDIGTIKNTTSSS